MDCSRCRGLMVVDACLDMDDDSGHLWFGAWRCVNCGQVVDLGVLRNRLKQKAGSSPLGERTRARRIPPRVAHAIRLSA